MVPLYYYPFNLIEEAVPGLLLWLMSEMDKNRQSPCSSQWASNMERALEVVCVFMELTVCPVGSIPEGRKGG